MPIENPGGVSGGKKNRAQKWAAETPKRPNCAE
jgi:hypothetical protein